MAQPWRQAVNEMCKQCLYDPLAGLGTWREQVGACPSRSCPLWEIRPLPARKRGAGEQPAALRRYQEAQSSEG